MFGIQGAYDKTLADAAVNDGWVTTLAPTDFGANIRDTLVGHARDDPVHAVLDPVPELGLDAVRRGPRLGRLPQGPARHARRDLGDRRAGARLRAAGGQDVRLGLLHRDQRQLHQLVLRLHDDRPDGPDLELSAAARVVPRRQLDLPDRDGRAVRRVVPRLVRDAVPVVDADDLRGGVRPGAPRSRRPGVGAAGGADHRPAVHHDPGHRGQRRSTPTRPTSGR